MRTPEVEAAMQHIGKDHVMGPEEYLFFRTARTLAAEIERLETDAKAMTIMLRGRGELVKRAEAAEARVKELEAQNARLREAPMQALGFAYAWACHALDEGKDPRFMEVPLLKEAWGEAAKRLAETGEAK